MNIKVLTISTVAAIALGLSACGGETPKNTNAPANKPAENKAPAANTNAPAANTNAPAANTNAPAANTNASANKPAENKAAENKPAANTNAPANTEKKDDAKKDS